LTNSISRSPVKALEQHSSRQIRADDSGNTRLHPNPTLLMELHRLHHGKLADHQGDMGRYPGDQNQMGENQQGSGFLLQGEKGLIGRNAWNWR
jgi:hypothetical protein